LVFVDYILSVWISLFLSSRIKRVLEEKPEGFSTNTKYYRTQIIDLAAFLFFMFALDGRTLNVKGSQGGAHPQDIMR
ncbi:hypothetical protein QUW13_05825, partial [Enterococcus hirae]|nr:hypothetical protein [Enterococcus hirae]